MLNSLNIFNNLLFVRSKNKKLLFYVKFSKWEEKYLFKITLISVSFPKTFLISFNSVSKFDICSSFLVLLFLIDVFSINKFSFAFLRLLSSFIKYKFCSSLFLFWIIKWSFLFSSSKIIFSYSYIVSSAAFLLFSFKTTEREASSNWLIKEFFIF